VAQQARNYFKVYKSDDDDEASWLDLSGLDLLVNPAASDLAALMADTGKKVLLQLGLENEHGLVNQVDEKSLAYAKDRAAEMVGKKWVDGQLVDNPNAEWVISDTTRDEINGLVSDVMSGKLDATDLPKSIMDSQAFSAERADMIAQTELISAHGQGTLDGFKAAKSIGVNVMKEWMADSDCCDICQENMDAGPIEVEDEFPSGDAAPAAHPRCECSIVAVVVTDSGDAEESDGEGED
jgi:hypothetical protein